MSGDNPMKKNLMFSKVCDYIAYRRSMGLVCSEESVLKLFAKFADKYYPGQPLTISMALEWATQPHPKKKSPKLRIERIRQLAKYLKIHDCRTELIPPKLEGRSPRFEPYIFSQEEIHLFVTTKGYTLPEKISEYSIKTVIGLLICTGMRIAEVLTLKKCDIDWKNGIILVRNSKRMSVRSIPIDRSTLEALRSYERFRDAHYPNVNNEHFFFLDNGKTVLYKVFWKHWRAIWRKIKGKKGEFAKKCPRIHDLRHTFACNHLLDAYKNKKDIDHELHLLSVYLGHVRVSSTYWYLSATPELLEHVGESFDQYVTRTRKSQKK
jgi:integrase